MTFDDYVNSLPTTKLSKAKQIILQMLWDAGHDFPRNWVASSAILRATNQKYFDRRARELRDEVGCDLESQYVEALGEHGWRLRSSSLLTSNRREYLTVIAKQTLFKERNNTCATCGKQVAAGVRGLQADHKIPLIRGGTHQPDNWQPICHNCNVGKRRACEGCNDECRKCSWAFPEDVGIKTVLDLPPELLSKLYQLSGGSHSEMNEFVKKALYLAIEM
jgi:hypothetical protein